MSFFEPPRPPEPPPEPEPEPKPWWHAPRNELGASIPLRLVVARNENVVVAVIDAVGYSTGLEFRLVVKRSTPSGPDDYVAFQDPLGRMGRGRLGSDELPPELLRFGVQFSDGRKATTLGHGLYREGEPERPVLAPGGGSGDGVSWETSLWLWPLPPPGPLAFVVEWPAEGIELTRAEVDAAQFHQAAARSEVLWPDKGGADGGGSWTGFGFTATEVDPGD